MLAETQNHPARYAAGVAMVGEMAIAEGRFEEAAAALDRALALNPALDVTRMLRGMNLLRLGRYAEGWPDYAALEAVSGLRPDVRATVWRGESLAGKTLLVTDDQGYGDSIQFFRYAPLLREAGVGSITWRTFSPLVRLLGESALDVRVLDGVAPDARFDFTCTSTSLPRIFGTELETIPAAVPYLWAPASVRPLGGAGLKVGLVWSGDGRHPRDHLRSIPAALFLELARAEGVRFHSLQHVVRDGDLAALEACPGIGRAVEAATDFADTAALIERWTW